MMAQLSSCLFFDRRPDLTRYMSNCVKSLVQLWDHDFKTSNQATISVTLLDQIYNKGTSMSTGISVNIVKPDLCAVQSTGIEYWSHLFRCFFVCTTCKYKVISNTRHLVYV